MERYRALVAYDGTDFSGFQRQAQGERTIQGTLENAILAVTDQAVTVIGAGRTDAGVHAEGQVIAFDVSWRHGKDALCRALNANLPPDLAVREVMGVAAGFHPRFAARRRVYRYLINSQPVRSPLLRRTSWHRRGPLDVAVMNTASQILLGEHDFATFGTPPSGPNTVRRIYVAEWHREGDMVSFAIEGNAFLYRMVRSLVGSLCQVGAGDQSVDAFIDIFTRADRSLAGPTAPPQGLCLLSVSF